MASSSSISFTCFLLFIFISSVWVDSISLSEAQTRTQLVKGLSFNFYKSYCPKLEKIVRDHLKIVFENDITLAAALLRIHFHDCFVQGCDGSVLLDGSSANGPSEKNAPPNLSLRAEAFKIINDLRELIHRTCGPIVSCSDISAIVARDSVFLSGGPNYKVPLGRRDGLNFATQKSTIEKLPSPMSSATALISLFSTLNLDPVDLVALSGAHTIGISHCSSFAGRLYPTQDASMDKTFARNLKTTCPTINSTNFTLLDLRSPNRFDNKYYVDLMNRQGLFTSDQDLYTEKRTRPIVTSFAANETLFFEMFVMSMIKMGQVSVLTGGEGEIRANCSAPNPATPSYISSVVDELAQDAAY